MTHQEHPSGPIVCATRGGKACRCTQERAVALAKERHARLIFLYVADPTFASPLDESLEAALVDELTRLGRWLLYIAQSRARRQGLEAEVVVRRGRVQPTIEEFVRESNAATLVVGAPQTSPLPQTFSPDEMNTFVETVQKATGVQVIVEAQVGPPDL